MPSKYSGNVRGGTGWCSGGKSGKLIQRDVTDDMRGVGINLFRREGGNRGRKRCNQEGLLDDLVGSLLDTFKDSARTRLGAMNAGKGRIPHPQEDEKKYHCTHARYQ